jgi:hypothetical protein
MNHYIAMGAQWLAIMGSTISMREEEHYCVFR